MTMDLRQELSAAIQSETSLEEIVALLRRYKAQGVAKDDVYSFLDSLRWATTDETTEDRILEVADFVAGFCSPHMKVWDNWEGPTS